VHLDNGEPTHSPTNNVPGPSAVLPLIDVQESSSSDGVESKEVAEKQGNAVDNNGAPAHPPTDNVPGPSTVVPLIDIQDSSSSDGVESKDVAKTQGAAVEDDAPTSDAMTTASPQG
jgi:hypothetical protein